jgi:hypothetical protein
MKCTIQVQRINSNLLQVTVDVGRDSLYAYSELPLENNAVRALEEIIPNRNQPVLQFLDQLAAIAREHRFAGLCILCEPSGGFEQRLLRLARQAGHHTAYLNAERLLLYGHKSKRVVRLSGTIRARTLPRAGDFRNCNIHARRPATAVEDRRPGPRRTSRARELSFLRPARLGATPVGDPPRPN